MSTLDLLATLSHNHASFSLGEVFDMSRALLAILLTSIANMLSLFIARDAKAQTSAPAPLVSKCATEKADGLEYRFCIDETDPSDNADLLYYFHGSGGSEFSWRQDPDKRLLLDHWKKMGVTSPTVITVSFGPQWLLTQQKRGAIADMHAYFVNVLLAKLEGQLARPHSGHRILVGESMGGFSAAMLLLKNASHFKKVALLCPGFASLSPFASKAEIDAYVARTGAKTELVESTLKWVRSEFPSTQVWQDHAPLELAAARLSKASPEIYVSCGERDEYGFFEGASKFVSIAQEKGATVHFRPVKGAHCAIDLEALAKFISPQRAVAEQH